MESRTKTRRVTEGIRVKTSKKKAEASTSRQL